VSDSRGGGKPRVFALCTPIVHAGVAQGDQSGAAPMTPVSTVAIVSKPRSPEAARVIPELTAWLAQQEVKMRLDANSAEYEIGRAHV